MNKKKRNYNGSSTVSSSSLINAVFKEVVQNSYHANQFKNCFLEFDRILHQNYVKSVQDYFEHFLSPVKIFLITTESDSVSTLVKFVANYLLYLQEYSARPSSGDKKEVFLKKSNEKVYMLVSGFLVRVLNSKESVVRLRSLQIIHQMLASNSFNVEYFMKNVVDANDEEDTVQNLLDRCQDKNSNIRLLAVKTCVQLAKRLSLNPSIGKESVNAIFEELLDLFENDSSWQIRNSVVLSLPEIKDSFSSTGSLAEILVRRTNDIQNTIRLNVYKVLSTEFTINQFDNDQILQLISNGSSEKAKDISEQFYKLFEIWFKKEILSERFKGNSESWLLKFIKDQNISTLDEISFSNLQDLLIKSFYNQKDELSSLKTNCNNNDNSDVEMNDSSMNTINESFEKITLKDPVSNNSPSSFSLEIIFHYLCLIKYWKKTIKSKSVYEEKLDQFLPTLTEFRDILLFHLGQENPLVLKLLLSVLKYYDLSDEVGRNNIVVFLKELLLKIPSNSENDTILNQILDTLYYFHKIERDFIIFIVELISDIIEPLDKEEIYPDLKRVAILEKTLAKFQKSKIPNPEEIKKLSTAIDSLKSSISEKEKTNLVKCSLVTHYLLLNVKKCSNSPEIDGLLNSVILPSIQDSSPSHREIGLKNLGIFCLHKRRLAIGYLSLFEKVLANDRRNVQLTCLRVIFDIVMVFGSPKQIPKETQSLYKTIKKLSQSTTDNQIKVICIEGFAKLMYSGIVYDSNILSFLILEYFSITSSLNTNTTDSNNESSKELLEIRKCLGLFLECYIVDRYENKILLFSTLSKLYKTILDSPNESSYSQIGFVDLTRYLMVLFSKASKDEKDHSAQESIDDFECSYEYQQQDKFQLSEIQPRIALLICEELIKSVRNSKIKELIKVLPMIKFDPLNHQQYLEKIYEIVAPLTNCFVDPILEKFFRAIESSVSKEFIETYLQSPSQLQYTNDLKSMFSVLTQAPINQNSNNIKQNFKSPLKTPNKSHILPLNEESSTIKNQKSMTNLLFSLNKSNKEKTSSLLKDYFQSQRSSLFDQDIVKESPKISSKSKKDSVLKSTLTPTTSNNTTTTTTTPSSATATPQTKLENIKKLVEKDSKLLEDEDIDDDNIHFKENGEMIKSDKKKIKFEEEEELMIIESSVDNEKILEKLIKSTPNQLKLKDIQSLENKSKSILKKRAVYDNKETEHLEIENEHTHIKKVRFRSQDEVKSIEKIIID